MGQSLKHIAKTLREGFGGTLLDTKFCAVLDGRSKEDGCVILMQTHGFPPVEGQDDISEPECITVRVPFERVAVCLGCYSLGEGDIYDHLEEHSPR